MGIKRETLKQYRSNEQEIQNLKIRLERLKKESFSEETLNEYIQRQIQRTTELTKRLQTQNDEVEEFVFSIKDYTTRRIFTLYYLDGKCQQEVASELNMERSSVSKKICTHWNKLTK